MINPSGSQQIPWSLFGGINSELSAPDLPEGLSPDCQDVMFVPGAVFTREGAQRLYPAFGQLGVTYTKTFTQPDGDPLNLMLTSAGVMRVEDVINNPGVTNVAFTTVPGIYASSVTAFGREYFAFHDGRLARDIPRQYDGTNWYRISQDGPACTGTQLQAADAGTSTVVISTIAPKAAVNIATMTLGTGFITTVTTTAHGLAVGDRLLITGNSVFEYNGAQTVATVPNPSTFTINSAATGLATGNGGEVIPDTVTVTTTVPHGLISGETITIAGDSDSNYNNSQGSTALTVALASNPVATFYTYEDHNGGAFNWDFPGDGFDEALPGPLGTYVFAANQSIFLNPNTDAGGTFLTGAPVNNIPPLVVYGVNAAGVWDGTSTQIFAGTYDFTMVITFQIAISAPGNVTFQIGHKEGVQLGIGGGATYVSGPTANPQPHTKTAQKGYPLVYANNSSVEFASVIFFNDQFTVNFPAAGIYPVEIDYAQWHHSRLSLSLKWQNSVPTFVPLQPGGVAFATPATWTVGDVLNSTQFKFDAVYASGAGTGGTITVGGQISPGAHQLCVSFQTDTDYITKPCPPVTWNAAGNKRVQVSGLPIGPPNTKARIIHLTGAGGGNFFYLPIAAVDPATGQQVSTSTVVSDNTSTSVTLDFSDNSLFEGISIDNTGNNLFAQVVLGPCAGIFSYSNRLAVFGDTNKIQNLLNMGFEGGTATVGGTTPLGWTVSGGGALVAGEFGYAWRITGNGTTSSLGTISQSAFQDYILNPVLTPSTQYTFECWAYASTANMTGNLIAEFYSPAHGGSLATATIAVNTLGVGSTNASFVSADFSAMTPATIPSDTIFRVYTVSTNNGASVTVDEMMVVYTVEPVVPGQVRFSYSINPEAFDGVTGILDIEYSEPIRTMSIIRDNLYIQGAGHLTRTADNGVGEPVTWTVNTVAEQMRGLSNRCMDVGEGWGVVACESGLYAFAGGEPQKISQEIQTLWDAIDPSLYRHVWLKNDVVNRRVYIGVPMTSYAPTGATFSPLSCNKILVMDYRELNSAYAIENAPPIHISMTGKMLSSDLTRKWTVWNLPMNCGDSLSLPFSQAPQVCFGGGNGQGLTGGFGNVYQLSDKMTDDDYGIIGSQNGEGVTHSNGVSRPQAAYYVTYFSPSHEQEQQLQIGSQRKLYLYLEAYVTGHGNFYAVPLIDRLGNATKRPPKLRLLSETQNYDFEWPLNVRAQRMAILFYALPLTTPTAPLVTISISPTSASVATNATHQFTTVVAGVVDESVTWSADFGTVSSSGLYTAPVFATTAHVTVTSVADPTKSATAVVTVT